MDTQVVAPRISVLLEDAERAALKAISNADRRPPQWTIRHLIVKEAQRRGLLPATNSNRAGHVLADTGAVADTVTIQSCP